MNVTHLKEMNERTQEELRELANKYNGAVNEIKDLSDKLKVAEGKQEEIQQKGQAEKKELQTKIDEMEEKEQELQAKIEALQADNDFTNERLTALQENPAKAKESDLSVQARKKAVTTLQMPRWMSKTQMNPLLRCLYRKMTYRVPSQKLRPNKTFSIFAKNWWKPRSYLEQVNKNALNFKLFWKKNKKPIEIKLRNQLNKYRFFKSSCRGYTWLWRISRRKRTLKSPAQEINCLVPKMRFCLFIKQQQRLCLSGRLTFFLCKTSLRRCRAELEGWRKATSEYENEVRSLQSSFQLRCQQCEDQQREDATRLQGELEKLKKERNVLETECHSLKKENMLLSSELQRQEKELHNSQKQSFELTSDLSVLQMTRKELKNQVGSLKEQHLRDAADLKTLLSKAENQAKDVQKEYEKTQTVLSELKLKFEMTEQEKQSITDELKQYKDNLKLLQEKGNNPSILQPVPAIFIGLFLAFLLWCFGPLW